MSKMTLALIALAAMLPTVCAAQSPMPYASGADHPPTENLTVRAPIKYPADAVRDRHEGIVVLKLLISAQGEIVERTVDTSSGWPELDQAALDASEHWEGAFNPGVKDGHPAEGYVRVPMTFQLPRSAK